jgi:hypothetical protein
MQNKEINWEKLGLYIAMITLIFMFWQAWRDVHTDISGIKERISVLETQIECLDRD